MDTGSIRELTSAAWVVAEPDLARWADRASAEAGIADLWTEGTGVAVWRGASGSLADEKSKSADGRQLWGVTFAASDKLQSQPWWVVRQRGDTA